MTSITNEEARRAVMARLSAFEAVLRVLEGPVSVCERAQANSGTERASWRFGHQERNGDGLRLATSLDSLRTAR